MRVTILVLALVAATGCAKVNTLAVATENAVTNATLKVSEEFRHICTAQELTAPCDDVRPAVRDLVAAAASFNAAVREQRIGGLTDVLAAAGRLAEKVKALPSGQTVQLVKNIAASVEAAAKGAQ